MFIIYTRAFFFLFVHYIFLLTPVFFFLSFQFFILQPLAYTEGVTDERRKRDFLSHWSIIIDILAPTRSPFSHCCVVVFDNTQNNNSTAHTFTFFAKVRFNKKKASYKPRAFLGGCKPIVIFYTYIYIHWEVEDGSWTQFRVLLPTNLFLFLFSPLLWPPTGLLLLPGSSSSKLICARAQHS